MSLEALAPDQRAVVQLVLQQGRSYADLAGLLGISEAAVRERAHRGLQSLAPAGHLDEDERAEVADFLLGQGSASAREATRSLLRTDAAANGWASAVAAELAGLPGAQLPDVPEARRRRAAGAAATGAEAAATTAPADEPEPEPDAPEPEPAADPEPAVRARPRPRRATRPAAAAAATDAEPETHDGPGDERGAAPRSSRLGGLLLVGIAAIVAVALVIFLVGRGGDDDGGTTASTGSTPAATATASSTATGDQRYQAVGQLNMTAPDGGKAKGTLVVFTDQQQGTLAFTLQAQGLQPNGTGNPAYGIWLVRPGAGPLRLGFNQGAPVRANGVLAVAGPDTQLAKQFTKALKPGVQVVVSRETNASAKQPGPIVLSGAIRKSDAG